MDTKYAKIYWNTQYLQLRSRGIRQGEKFYTVLCNAEEMQIQEAWSVWFVSDRQIDGTTYDSVIAFSFLMDNPASRSRFEQLTPGTTFFLLEGPHLLGHGVVVEQPGESYEV